MLVYSNTNNWLFSFCFIENFIRLLCIHSYFVVRKSCIVYTHRGKHNLCLSTRIIQYFHIGVSVNMLNC